MTGPMRHRRNRHVVKLGRKPRVRDNVESPSQSNREDTHMAGRVQGGFEV